MVYLDYQKTGSLFLGNNTASILFTAPYRCVVMPEIEDVTGLPTPGFGPTGGLFIQPSGASVIPSGIISEYPAIITGTASGTSGDLGNVAVGSAVMSSGDILVDRLEMSGRGIFIVLHYFRLPEAP